MVFASGQSVHSMLEQLAVTMLRYPRVRAMMWREIEEAEGSRIAKVVKGAVEQRRMLEALEASELQRAERSEHAGPRILR